MVLWLSYTGIFRRIQALAVGKMQRSQNWRKETEKGKIRYKEEELTPPYFFWHQRHPEYMTYDFFQCITEVGGLTWSLPHLLLIYHLPPTFKIQNYQNLDFLSWLLSVDPPSFQHEDAGVNKVCFDPEPDLKVSAQALLKLWAYPKVKQVLQLCLFPHSCIKMLFFFTE